MIAAAGMVFLCLFLFSTGCVKKSVIGEQSGLSEDKISAQTQAKPAVMPKGGKAVTEKEEATSKASLTTETLKEETLVEGPAATGSDRPMAEKDKATQLMLAKESSAADASSQAGAVSKSEADLKDIHFDYDKFSLNSEEREILKGHAEWLSRHGDYIVTIEGHCDERGTTEYNLALGSRRAEEVKRFLVDLGVEETRIKTISYGEELPLDAGHDEQAWARNRRAHFTVALKP
jgi:peptidoglycan-associated lipoprotein